MLEITRPSREYRMATGFRLDYNPSETLPPDIASEELGYRAAAVINTLRFQAQDPQKPVYVLELGVGSGISLVSTLERTLGKTHISLVGIDIDESAVKQTQDNLRKLVEFRGYEPEVIIFQADWKEPTTWNTLEQEKYQVILFNPPYLPSGESVRSGYAEVPRHTMYTDDEEGLEHYATVLPHLAPLLSDDDGSTIFIRNSVSILSQPLEDVGRVTYEQLLEGVLDEIPGGKIMQKTVLAFVGTDRKTSWVSISRTDSTLPPYENPMIFLDPRYKTLYENNS